MHTITRREHPGRFPAAAVLLSALAWLGVGAPAGPQSPPSRPQGPYLGQTPPGNTPVVFAPGVVSTDAHEFACSFTPDGREFYFTRRETPRSPTLIMVTRRTADGWTTAEPAAFNDASARMTFEPRVTPDGRRLYFSSDRPLAAAPAPGGMPALNIWYVEREGGAWSPPREAGPPFNPMRAMYVSAARSGTIYTTDISGGPGTEGIAVARLASGSYAPIERLGPPLNRAAGDMYPYIDPDERYLIYTSRTGQTPGETRLLASFHQADGGWGEPRPIPLGMPAGTPMVSPDGQYLFFTAGERGRSDIYWVSARVLDARAPTSSPSPGG